MKFLSLLIALLSLQIALIEAVDLFASKLFFNFQDHEKILPKNVEINPAVTSHVITHRVDHFNPQNLGTYENLYLTNDEFFQPNGPLIIFLYIDPSAFILAGETYLSLGPVHDFARELNGTLVSPQHRYHEGSVLSEDLSTENLRFLTVAQALEDLAHLIVHLKSAEEYRNSGVIIVGIDYGASLATWLAQKYPHLVSGIWASGGRVHSTLEQPQPVQIVEDVLRLFGDEACYNRTENGFREVEDMVASNQTRSLERTFKLCFPLPYDRDDLDLAMFFQILATDFYVYAQFLDAERYQELCDRLNSAPVTSDYEALAYIMGFHTVPSNLCFPVSFTREMSFFKDIEDGTEYAVSRKTLYFYCTELGLFFTSGYGTSIFGARFPIDFLVAMCEEVFGFTRDQIEENLRRFNVMNAGQKPIVRNAYFTNGEFYPWTHQNVDPLSIDPTSVHEVIPNRGLLTEILPTFDDPIFAEVRARVLVAAKGWLGITEDIPQFRPTDEERSSEI